MGKKKLMILDYPHDMSHHEKITLIIRSVNMLNIKIKFD